MKKLITILFGCFLTASINAQDYHLSQYDVIPMAMNPALTGMNTGKLYRAAAVYRSQWKQLSSRAFSTFGLSYDMKLHDRWGAGVHIVNNDRARAFNSLMFIASGAYEITASTQRKHRLTTGLQLGFIYNTINQSDLTFDNQYGEGDFNGNLPSLETFQRGSKTMPEVNWGVAYKWTDPNREYHPYVGIAAGHLLSPKNSFFETGDEAPRLPRKFTFNGGSEYELNEKFTFDGKVLAMFQGQASEILFGVNSFYDIKENENTIVQLGLYYRNKDAFIVSTGVEYQGLIYVMSFDFTTSGLNEYGGGTGALEFSLVFTPNSNISAPRMK